MPSQESTSSGSELRAPARDAVTRDRALDAVRGLAVACMVVDHLALFAGVEPVRLTVGRLAMPLFFLLGGHLVRRYSLRTFALVPLVGLVVEYLAPWSGAAGLLLAFSGGALVVLLARRVGPGALALVVVVALALAANGWSALDGPYYDARASVALMCAGALLPRQWFAWGRHVGFLAPLGRFPLTVYAGHVLVLTVLFGAP